MRTAAITVHNTEKLEIFVEKRKRHFEVWLAGSLNGRRTLLDHRLTHDDLEAHLEYARPGDLVWRDATSSEIPGEKHRNAIEMEATIKEGTFWDYDDPRLDEMEAEARQASGLPPWSGSHRSVARHLDSVSFLITNKEAINAAKKSLLGQWTDGVLTLDIKPDHKLGWSCTDLQHPLNVAEQVQNHRPDWWNFAMWNLALMNNEHKCGTRIGVLRVDAQELHIYSGHPHRIAHVFKRIGKAEGIIAKESKQMPVRPGKTSRVEGVATPLLMRLERAIARQNPLLAERLKAGLRESDIRAALHNAKVTGAIEPIIELYSWRNGTALDEQTPMMETSFFPENIYQFMDLETAIGQLKMINKAASQLQEMFEGTKARSMFSDITGSLFPLFTDGGTGTIAVDLTPGKRNRVVAIEFESTEPVRQAYRSFEEFIKDATRANKDGDSLSCFQAA